MVSLMDVASVAEEDVVLLGDQGEQYCILVLAYAAWNRLAEVQMTSGVCGSCTCGVLTIM